MIMTIRELTPAERNYTYTQSLQIKAQTGCIGHLRADMGSNGEGFFSSWTDHREYLKTDEFKKEIDTVIGVLRGLKQRKGFTDKLLKNRKALLKYCSQHSTASYENDLDDYGFRVDTDTYSYLMRVNPRQGVYNLYMYCYKKDWLDGHLRKAEKGIRFIDPNYNKLFTIIDGGKIKYTMEDNTVFEKPVRYIDDYHFEDEITGTIWHICEFAEKMLNDKIQVSPIDILISK